MAIQVEFKNYTKKDTAALELRVNGALEEVSEDHNLSAGFQARPNKLPLGNFRPVVTPVRYFDSKGRRLPFSELLIDPSRAERLPDFEDRVLKSTRYLLGREPLAGAELMEGSSRPDESHVNDPNYVYWRHITKWPDFGKQLPTGVPDSVNPEFWADRVNGVIVPMFRRLDSANLLPDQVSMLELGASSGETAAVMIEKMRAAAVNDPDLDRVLRKTVVYLADYSKASLEKARERFLNSEVQVVCLNGDTTQPHESFPELADKQVVFAHAGNLLDNLPSGQVKVRNGAVFEKRVAMYLDRTELEGVSHETGVPVTELREAMRQLVTPAEADNLRTDEKGIEVWQKLWGITRLMQDYHQIDDPREYKIVEGEFGFSVADLMPMMREGANVVLSDHAANTVNNTLGLMHPSGRLQILDLFREEGEETKMDGSFYLGVNRNTVDLVVQRRGMGTNVQSFSGYNPRSFCDIYTVGRGLKV